ncbi:hypothetical protein PS685_04209 [Pseudomonas fluorescens]|uniref:Uncharacterized protein n=1 Tax=Pseudomonas fluorescens TaxID=294 RepID=A0A5E6ZAP3_PSEFL|nr:hypothetical protein PS685_04209 [Pseudomonas fluorescens]
MFSLAGGHRPPLNWTLSRMPRLAFSGNLRCFRNKSVQKNNQHATSHDEQGLEPDALTLSTGPSTVFGGNSKKRKAPIHKG